MLSRFSRVTASGRIVPEIDGLRFFAVAMVLVVHVNDSVAHRIAAPPGLAINLLNASTFGVELFFAISGFVLALPFARAALAGAKQPELSAYYVRRVFRIEPPYIINMVALFAYFVLVKRQAADELFPHLAASLTYTHNMFFGAASTINPAAWSLEVEVQFYLLAPLLASVYLLRTFWMRVACFSALPFMVAGLAGALGILSRQNLTGNLHWFCTGFVLADLYSRRAHVWQSSRWFDMTALAAWLAIGAVLAVAPRGNLVGTMVLTGSVFVLYLSAFRSVIWRGIVSNPWLVTIGGMCYSIYLWQGLILGPAGRATAVLLMPAHYWASLAVQLVLLCPVVIVVSASIFLVAEKPFMRRGWWVSSTRQSESLAQRGVV